MAEFAINNSVNTSTGYSPNELLYGRKMLSPASCKDLTDDSSSISTSPFLKSFRDRLSVIRNTAALWDQSGKRRRNDRINAKRNHIKFNIGDEILYKRIKTKGTHREGFTFNYEGPYVVTDKVSEVTYKVRDPNAEGDRIITAHTDRLKKYVRRIEEASKCPVPITDLNGDILTDENDNAVGKDGKLSDGVGSQGTNLTDCREDLGSRTEHNQSLPGLLGEESNTETSLIINNADGDGIVNMNMAEDILSTNVQETVQDDSGDGLTESPDDMSKELPVRTTTDGNDRVNDNGDQEMAGKQRRHKYFTRSVGNIDKIDYSKIKFDRAGKITIASDLVTKGK